MNGLLIDKVIWFIAIIGLAALYFCVWGRGAKTRILWILCLAMVGSVLSVDWSTLGARHELGDRKQYYLKAVGATLESMEGQVVSVHYGAVHHLDTECLWWAEDSGRFVLIVFDGDSRSDLVAGFLWSSTGRPPKGIEGRVEPGLATIALESGWYYCVAKWNRR